MNTEPLFSSNDDAKKVASNEFETKLPATLEASTRSSSVASLATSAAADDSSVATDDCGELQLGPLDCLCGRGRVARNLEGNRRFQSEISRFVEEYVKLKTKQDKSIFIRHVMGHLCEEIGFRFVKKPAGRRTTRLKDYHSIKKESNKVDNNNDTKIQDEYVELDAKEIYEKVGHSLRDLSVKLYGAKSSLRRQEEVNTGSATRQQQQPHASRPVEGVVGTSEYYDLIKKIADDQTSTTSLSSHIPTTVPSSVLRLSDTVVGQLVDPSATGYLLSRSDLINDDVMDPLPLNWEHETDELERIFEP